MAPSRLPVARASDVLVILLTTVECAATQAPEQAAAPAGALTSSPVWWNVSMTILAASALLASGLWVREFCQCATALGWDAARGGTH